MIEHAFQKDIRQVLAGRSGALKFEFEEEQQQQQQNPYKLSSWDL